MSHLPLFAPDLTFSELNKGWISSQITVILTHDSQHDSGFFNHLMQFWYPKKDLSKEEIWEQFVIKVGMPLSFVRQLQ